MDREESASTPTAPSEGEKELTAGAETTTSAALSKLLPYDAQELFPAGLLIRACQWYRPFSSPETVTVPVTGLPEYTTALPELVTVSVKSVPTSLISIWGVRESDKFSEFIENFRTTDVS